MRTPGWTQESAPFRRKQKRAALPSALSVLVPIGRLVGVGGDDRIQTRTRESVDTALPGPSGIRIAFRWSGEKAFNEARLPPRTGR